MEQEATRDDVWLFAQAVEHLGYRRNISTGRMIPLPPDTDATVATYEHRDTGRLVCVWPVTTDDQAAELGTIADRYGFTFVQFGRPQPRQNTQHSDGDDRCAAGHRPRPDGTCPVCAAPRTDLCNGGQVAGRTPAEAKRAHHVGRLQALSTQASINWADAYTRGEHRAAMIHQDDAEAFAAGAAALRQPPTQPFVDVLRALLRRDGPDADKPTCDLLAKAHELLAEADRHG